ncbi:MAG: MFS transporter [Conexivisphaerales archaeon]
MKDGLRIAFLFGYNSCLGIFLTYGVFFNKVASEFHQHAVSTSAVFAVFAVAYSISSLLLGRLMMQQGAAKTILAGGLLMAGGLAASGAAQSIPMLVTTYGAIAGAGSGSMWLPTSYAVFETFDYSKIRSVTGIVSAGTAFGSLFFAPFEALAIVYFGWRLTFEFLAAIVCFLAVGASVSSKGSRQLQNEVKEESSSPITFRDAVAKVSMKKDFLALYLYYMLGNAFARTIVMIFVVPMLESRGLSLLVSSLATALIGAGSMVGRGFTSLQRLSEESIAGLSFIIQGLSSLVLPFTSNPIIAYIFSFTFGIGYGGYIPQFALIVRKRYGMAFYSAIFGILLTSFGIGAFFGPILGGYDLMLTKEYTQMFLISSGISIAVGLHQILTSRSK